MTADPPWLLDHAPHTPFLEPRTARPPGLAPLGELPLALAGPDFAAQMAERERLLAAARDTCIAARPEGAEPARELLGHVIAAMDGREGFALEAGRWRRPDGARVAPDADDPLASLGAMTAEDWCLLSPDPAAGEYRLLAAVLCFPSRWSLAEKLGRPLTAIHAPVPDYDAALARRVNRVFEGLRAGRPVWRVNWLVHPTAELHLPLGEGEKAAPRPARAERLYLRVERQTLTRLPGTGAVAFGIRTRVTPIEALAPAVARGLADALGGLDAATVAYRSGADLQRAAIARLRALGAEPAAVAERP